MEALPIVVSCFWPRGSKYKSDVVKGEDKA